MDSIRLEDIVSENTRQSIQSVTGDIDMLNESIKGEIRLLQLLEQQLRGVQRAFEAANAEGKDVGENITLIRNLRDEVSRLRTELNGLANQNTTCASTGRDGFSTLQDSITAMSGAVSVGINTAELFGMKQEKLTEIQAKLQNVMAITQGLQQMANLLTLQGAQRNTLLAGTTTFLSTATTGLATALGISTVAAQALMATLTLGLSVAIIGLVLLFEKLSTAQTQAQKASAASLEVMTNAQERYNDNFQQSSNSYGEQRTILEKLRKEWGALGDNMNAKNQFIANNKTLFDQLNVSVSSVHDAEKILSSDTGSFVEALKSRARAMAALDTVKGLYSEQLKAEQAAADHRLGGKVIALTKREEAQREADRRNNVKSITSHTNGVRTSWKKVTGDDVIKEMQAAKENEAILEDLKAKKTGVQIERFTNKYLGESQNETNIYKQLNLTPSNGSNTGNTGKTPTIDIEKVYNNIAAAEISAIVRMQEQVLAIRQDGFDKQRAQAELNYQNELRRIGEHEAKLREEYDLAKKAGKPVDKERIDTNAQGLEKERGNAKVLRDQNITALYQKEAKEKEDAFKALVAPYRNYKMQMEDLQKEFEEAKNKLEASRSDIQLQKVKKELGASYNGNLKLEGDNRWKENPNLSEQLKQNGWESHENGNIPLKQFTVQQKAKDGSGKMEFVEVLVTPVTKDGVVLSQKGLEEYIKDKLEGQIDLNSADSRGILVATNVDKAGVDAAAIKSGQKEYYNLQNEDTANARNQQVDAALEQLDVQKSEAENSLALVFAQKDAYFQAFMGQLVDMTLKDLEKALTNAENALAAKSDSGNTTPDQLAVAKAKVATLKEEVKKTKAEKEVKGGDERKKWEKTASAIKGCKSEIDNMIGSMDFLDESTKSALQTASNIAGGAIGMINGIKLLSLGAAEGVKGVERASVILAIVGAAIQIMTAIFSMASGAEKKHQKALAEIASEKLAMQREYNLLLLQQALLMKEATTIFGEQQIAKAVRAVEVYRKAIGEYKEELQGEVPTLRLNPFNRKASMDAYNKDMDIYKKGIGALNNITIKTGHKKTGLWGMGSGKDIYSSVLSVYDDLIDGEKRLNVERAKTIINTHSMSDANKNLLQHLIDLQEQADEAQESLRDYLEETFGSLGDGIMESITSAIMDDGVDAWELFGEKGAEVLGNLGKQLTYSLFFAEKFAKLQKDLEAVYGSGKSEEEIARDSMALVGDFYNNIGAQMDAAQEFMENFKAEGSKHGFDLWKSEGSEQSGQAGGFTSMSQDQGTKLEGLFTSLQDHTSSIDYTVIDISRTMYEASDKLSEIARNTSYCVHLEQMAGDIAELKRDGIKMK